MTLTGSSLNVYVDGTMPQGLVWNGSSWSALVGQPFTQEPYGIGTPKSHPEMKKFVDDWLQQIEKSGEWADLWKATIGTVVKGDAPQPPQIGSVPGS